MQTQKSSNDRNTNSSHTGAATLKEDLSNLKGDAVALKNHLTEEGKVRASQIADQAQTKLSGLGSASRVQLQKLEASVRDNPQQSILFAFLAGVAASFILGRR